MRILNYKDVQLNNTVVALGKFEGLHKGHMLLLNKVLELSKKLKCEATLCTIDFPKDKQLYTDEERFSIIEEAGIINIVRCQFTEEFASMSPKEFFVNFLVKCLGVKAIVIGADFRFGYNRSGNVDTLKEFGIEYGVEVIVIDKLLVDSEVVSTSTIKTLISEGRIEIANSYLGRRYSVQGQVMKGKQLGRTIGFPTANIIPGDDKLLPIMGVYESKVLIDGVFYKGLTNVGDNPTVQNDHKVTVETYVLDYSGDLYDKIIKVCFVRFIRKEMKFPSLEALISQMNDDRLSIQ